jgi:hypothetical protein
MGLYSWIKIGSFAPGPNRASFHTRGSVASPQKFATSSSKRTKYPASRCSGSIPRPVFRGRTRMGCPLESSRVAGWPVEVPARLRHRTRPLLRKRLSDCGGGALSFFMRKTAIPRPEPRGPSPGPLGSGRGTGREPLRLDLRASARHSRTMVASLTTPKPLFAATPRKAISYPLSFIQFRSIYRIAL